MKHSPLLVLIYAEGCPACEDAKPHFQRASERLPQVRFQMLDVDKPGLNLDFPIEYTPTLYLAINGRRFATDPNRMKRSMTETAILEWVAAATEKAFGVQK